MVSAFVLIQAEVGKSAQVLSALREIDGVAKAVVVTGPYDIVAKAEAADLNELGKLVAGSIQLIAGIARTITCTTMTL